MVRLASETVPSNPRDPAGGAGGDLLATSAAGPAAIRGGALRAAGYAAGVLLSVGSAALLFRHLGVDDTGRYVTVVSLVAIVGGLSDVGLTGIGVRELSIREGHAREGLARNLLGLRVVLTMVGVALAALFAGVAGYGEVLVVGTVLAGLGVLFLSVQSTLAISLISRLRLGWVTAFELLRQVVSVGLILVLVVAGARLLAFLAIPIPLAALIALGLTALRVRGDIPLVPSFDRSEWWALLRRVLPYAIASTAGVLYFRVAIILVSILSSAKQTGYFGASFRIVDVLVAFPAMLVGAAFPIFARAARDDHIRLAYAVGRVFEVCFILGVLTGLCLALGAPVAISVVGGAHFEPAADVLRIQGLAVGGSFVGAVWAYALLSLGRYREVLVFNVGALALNAILVVVLTAADGARGAAIGTAIAELVLAVMGAVVLTRVSPLLRPPLGKVPRVLLAAGIASTLALVPGLPTVALVAGASAIYLLLILVLRAVPPEILAEMRRRTPATV